MEATQYNMELKTCDNCKHNNIDHSFGESLKYCRWCSVLEEHIEHTNNWEPKENENDSNNM